jgi:hypothetical protein
MCGYPLTIGSHDDDTEDDMHWSEFGPNHFSIVLTVQNSASSAFETLILCGPVQDLQSSGSFPFCDCAADGECAGTIVKPDKA